MIDTDRISASTAALLLGVTLSGVRNMTKRGELRHRINEKGHRQFSVIDVLALRALRARQGPRRGRPSIAQMMRKQLKAAKAEAK